METNKSESKNGQIDKNVLKRKLTGDDKSESKSPVVKVKKPKEEENSESNKVCNLFFFYR